MLLKNTVLALTLALACEASIIPDAISGLVVRQNNGNKFGGNNGGNNGANNGGNNGANNGGNNNGGNNAANKCLNANAIQSGSASDGNQVPAAGQAASKTDAANFINFCSGQTLTNGLQTKTGSCNGVVMGKIPSTQNMISAIITSPKPAENLPANKDFTISVQTRGLTAGSFTNAQATYYSAPQDLAGNGQIIGHTHVTVQDLGNSLQPNQAPDPVSFVFFKGINDAGNGNGLLSATVTGGLPAGNYRVCSMTSASNHQPVLMPVAQRGAQDDCQKFTVGAGGGGGNGGNNNGGNNNANANGGNANGGNNKAAGNGGNANANANGGNANGGNIKAAATGGNANAGNANANFNGGNKNVAAASTGTSNNANANSNTNANGGNKNAVAAASTTNNNANANAVSAANANSNKNSTSTGNGASGKNKTKSKFRRQFIQ